MLALKFVGMLYIQFNNDVVIVNIKVVNWFVIRGGNND